MEQPTSSYRREFFRSPHHAWMGVLTVGLGFATGEPLYFLAGVTAYVLGWIYLPDLGLFRGWVDRRAAAEREKLAAAEIAAFETRRRALLEQLSPARHERYTALAQVCGEIEEITAENSLGVGGPGEDARLRKLDELMWTYLRLLGIEESLDRFLETERRENVPQLALETEAEIKGLKAEVEALRLAQPPQPQALENRQRLLNSCLDTLDVLQKRLSRLEQAQSNHSLVLSEQDRLEHQIKLLRADAMASKNADNLSTRISATVEHLEQTNRWISELGEFNDLVGAIPEAGKRVGYGAGGQAPPVIAASFRNPPKSHRTA